MVKITIIGGMASGKSALQEIFKHMLKSQHLTNIEWKDKNDLAKDYPKKEQGINHVWIDEEVKISQKETETPIKEDKRPYFRRFGSKY